MPGQQPGHQGRQLRSETTRQQMIEAAAAFDYILFGSVGWTRTDTPDNVTSQQLQDYETLPIQVGIKQTTVTGARSPSRRP